MKNQIKLLGLALLTAGTTAYAAQPQRMQAEELSSTLTKRLYYQNGRQWRKDVAGTHGQKKVITEAPAVTPATSTWGVLNNQEGEEWMYTIDYTYTNPPSESYSKTIQSAEISVYNANFELVKTVTANFELGENETTINDVELAPTLTKKFFNVDNAYEIMVYVHATTVDYSGHNYTQIYSLDNGELITTVEGYNVGAIDNSKDAWSENFVMAFLREDIEFTDDGDVNYMMYFDIYGKAPWGGTCELLHTFDVDYALFSGAGNYALPLLMTSHNDNMYYALPHYEKPYFEGMMSDAITPDNHFIIELYDNNFNLVKTTSIPMETEEGALFTFPGMGELTGNDDLDFTIFSNGIEPMYIVGNENYIPGADEFVTSLYVYDTDGNRVKQIIYNTENYIGMTDVKGFERQWCFYFPDDITGGEYRFVNLPSCETAAVIPVLCDNNIVSTELDRVPQGSSYKYAASLAYADGDSQGNTCHLIAWFKPDGSLDYIDSVNLGKGIAMAMPYIAGFVLNPYLLNTDGHVEYMFLVKQYSDIIQQTNLKEYLRVYSDNNMVLDLGPEEATKAVLTSIFFINVEKTNPKLVIAYYGDNGFRLHALSLPLSRFTAGDGTPENPYILTTPGDVMTMYTNPASSFKLMADIDFEDIPWEGNKCTFIGELDGNNHTIKNLHLIGSGMFDQISKGAVIKNLNIENVTMEISNKGGVLCAWLNGEMAQQPLFENVNIKNINASSTRDVTFGGFAAIAAMNPKFRGCSVTEAYINFPNGSIAGGIAGSIRTRTEITDCVFDGTIIANVAGGIAGESISADEVISNCHALVNIEGRYAAGGIVGESGRSIVTNCFVDGAVKANGEKNAAAGGIVGYLDAAYTTDKTGNVVEKCIVAATVSASISIEGARNQAIAHRIIGFTSGDEWLVDWESKDPNFNPSDPTTYPYVKGSKDYSFRDNYAVGIEKIDAEEADDANSTEGKTISADDITDAFLADLNFKLGDSYDAPWTTKSLSLLALYFETYDITAEESKLHLDDANGIDGTPAIAVFHIDRLYADKVEIKVESTNVAEIGKITVSPDGYTIECEVYCIGSGATELVATLGNKKAVINVSTTSSNIDIIGNPAASMKYDGSTVKAEGEISIYTVSGICVARGFNEVSTAELSEGIYIATNGIESIKIKK